MEAGLTLHGKLSRPGSRSVLSEGATSQGAPEGSKGQGKAAQRAELPEAGRPRDQTLLPGTWL